MKSVYLAGPIAGLNYKEATDWRKYFASKMPKDIVARSPMRGKEYLEGEGLLTSTDNEYRKHSLSSAEAVVARDRFDCNDCDAVIFNFLGAKTVSIGTCIEIGWADAARKPMILIMEPYTESFKNVHEHIIIRGTCGFQVTTIDEAIDVVKAVLSNKFAKKYQ